MLRHRCAISTTRRFAWLFALMLSAASAHAQSASRPSPAGGASLQQTPAQAAPARFFRISDVLSQRGAEKKIDGENAILLAAHGTGDVLSDAPLRGSISPTGEEPFGLAGFRAPDGPLWRKWRAVASEIAGEAVVIARCRADTADCTPAARQFLAILEMVRDREGRARLDEVNRHINSALRYTSDVAQHGEADRWSAPLAALGARRGDCEDYAIAKYVILREAGYPQVDLRFVLVRDRLSRDDHAVLAARFEGRWLILDNRFATIPEDHRMHNFTPLFALDHEGVKLLAAPYARVPVAMGAESQPTNLFDGEELTLRGAINPATQESGKTALPAGNM